MPVSAVASFAGKTVLITGASSGIGRAFVHYLAAADAEVVLVARRAAILEQLAGELRARHDATVHVIPADLALPGAAADLHRRMLAQGLTIDAVINNAGIGVHGDLVEADPATVTAQIQLNVTVVAQLSTLLLPAMVARGHGAIINIASTAAFQPVAHMAVYAATKAFVLSFTRALWAETRHTGVAVLAVCPGATDTEFFQTAGEQASVGTRRSPEDVVNTTLRALARRRPSVVDGRANALVAALAPRLPGRLALSLAERSVRPSNIVASREGLEVREALGVEARRTRR
jgi:short-subunit dehydrogenase